MWCILCILSFLYFELLSPITLFLRLRSKWVGLTELQMSGRLSENINALLKGPAGEEVFPWWDSPASPATPGHQWGHSTALPRGAARPSLTSWPESQSNTEPRSLLELENCVNLSSGRLAQSNLFYSRKIRDQFCILHWKTILGFLVPTFDFSSFGFYFSLPQGLVLSVNSRQCPPPTFHLQQGSCHTGFLSCLQICLQDF